MYRWANVYKCGKGLVCLWLLWCAWPAVAGLTVYANGDSGFNNPNPVANLRTIDFATVTMATEQTASRITYTSSTPGSGQSVVYNATGVTSSSGATGLAGFSGNSMRLTTGTSTSTVSQTVTFSGGGTPYVAFLWGVSVKDENSMAVVLTLSSGGPVTLRNCQSTTSNLCVAYYAPSNWLADLLDALLGWLLGGNSYQSVYVHYVPDNGVKITQMQVTATRCDGCGFLSSNASQYFQLDNLSYLDATVVPHHLEVTTSSASVGASSDTVFTIKACANASCSLLYTTGVSGTLGITGVTPTFPSGASFNIASGTSSTSVTASMSQGTATAALASLSKTPSNTPQVFCGMGVAAASGNSCSLSITQPLHHMEVTTGAVTGVTCTPLTYTIKACSTADCSSTYTAGLSGSLSLTGTPTVNYTSAFTIPASSATTTVSAHITTIGAVTAALSGLSATPTNTPQVFCGMGAAAASGGSCVYTAVDSALLFDVGNHVSEAEQTVTVSAVRSSNNATVCTPAFASVDKAVKFKCTYSNPGSGTLPVRVADATYNTYGALNSGNSTSAVCDLTGRNVTLAFNASGVATAKVKYADVGLVGMTARYDGSGSDAGLVMQGSDTFVAAPASFTVAGVPAGNIAAGSNFAASATVTVTANNSVGTKVSNFGNETPPATATLAFTKYRPTSAHNGTFSGTLGSFSNGEATASTLSWTEVGSGDLSASLTGASYLSSGLTASGSTGSTGAVGPFVPHHFTVETTNACGSFTYSGQPFTATVTAVNAAGDRTYNYDGTAATNPDFAKTVTLSAATNGGTGSMGSASILPSSFDTGVATVSTPVFTFTTKQTGPTTITVGATDTDGVSSSGYTEGSVALRSGRLKLSNAFGTGESALAMQVQTQYWSGKTWIISAGDSCTSVPANAVALSNYTNAHGAAGSWTTTPIAITISNGLGSLSLSTPSPSGSGTVDVALNLGSTAADNACLGTHPVTTAGNLSWLRTRNGNCAATFDRDPAARATFGVYSPETRKTVYVRPMF
jgi:hypothetical protein